MEVIILEVLAGLALTMVCWLHIRQNRQEDDLNNKVYKEDFQEVKGDIKEILKSLTSIKVENAKWQGLVERMRNSKQ